MPSLMKGQDIQKICRLPREKTIQYCIQTADSFLLHLLLLLETHMKLALII